MKLQFKPLTDFQRRKLADALKVYWLEIAPEDDAAASDIESLAHLIRHNEVIVITKEYEEGEKWS